LAEDDDEEDGNPDGDEDEDDEEDGSSEGETQEVQAAKPPAVAAAPSAAPPSASLAKSVGFQSPTASASRKGGQIVQHQQKQPVRASHAALRRNRRMFNNAMTGTGNAGASKTSVTPAGKQGAGAATGARTGAALIKSKLRPATAAAAFASAVASGRNNRPSTSITILQRKGTPAAGGQGVAGLYGFGNVADSSSAR
jgi:hypothetical protein